MQSREPSKVPLPFLFIISVLLAAMLAVPARAQDTTVLQAENVRFDYAQVLKVEPVYQVLRATRMEERCDNAAEGGDSGKLTKIVGAVAGAVKDAVGKKAASPDEANCRTVPVEREFRRPIAFDVDYAYRGAKYRSRLPMDPGNRLRVKVSLTPVVPAIEPR